MYKIKPILYPVFFILLLMGNHNLVAGEIITITTQPLEQLVFHPVKKAPAQVVTLQNSLLSSELSARVEQVFVQVGDRVTSGQALVRLECFDFQLNKQQLQSEQKSLEADRKFAQYQYERTAKLLKTKSVSQEAHRRQVAEFNRLTAQRQLLINKIKQADKVISRCEIKAPFDGVITERLANMGENVAPQTPLLRLIDVDNLEVEVQVPVIVVDDLDYTSLDFVFRNQRYPLILRAIVPGIETRARHQRVRLRFIDKKALPNAFGMVEITLRDLHIPANYLLTRQSQVGIFILDKNSEKQGETGFQARFHAIEHAMIGRDAVINLPLDTQVIIEGRHALTDGQGVELQAIDSVNH